MSRVACAVVGTPLDDLVDLLELEQLEVNLFRGRSPKKARERVFGGQVLAQALVAAGRTVDADVRVHSLHAYFLRPGDPRVADHLRRRPHPRRAELHHPPRRRDPARRSDLQRGRRRSTSPRTGPTTRDPMPDVPATRCDPRRRARAEWRRGEPDRPRRRVARGAADRHALPRRRPAGRPTGRARARPGHVAARQRHAARRPARCTRRVVAYASDITLLGTATLPHASPGSKGFMIGEPRPRDVVPPAVPRRRVAAVPPAQPVGDRRAGLRRRVGVPAATASCDEIAQEGLIRPMR